MLFTITAKHMQISDNIKSYAEQKTSKLSRYYNGINRIEVIFERDPGDKFKAEIIARGEHSKLFIATETAEEACLCIDGAVQKLERQLSRQKKKERSPKHKTGTQ